MLEIVAQDRALFLCTQKQGQSEVEYLRALQSTVDAFNEAGGMAGITPRSIKLVCSEQKLVYDSIPNDLDGRKKKQEIHKEAGERYVAAVGFSGLDNRRHSGFKLDVKIRTSEATTTYSPSPSTTYASRSRRTRSRTRGTRRRPSTRSRPAWRYSNRASARASQGTLTPTGKETT